METIPVIIPYYRAPEALKKTIACAQKQVGVETEIFVRDNSEDNILFTRAVNEGLRKYCYKDQYKYCLILNHDAYLNPDALISLVNTMEADPEVGICSPVQRDTEGVITWAGSMEAYPWGQAICGEVNDLPKEPFATYWANGACMLISTRMVREIGLLDENMQFICSDADYSFTARSRGFHVVVDPHATVIHKANSSAGTNRGFNTLINHAKLKDHLYFSQKWVSGDLYKSISHEGKNLTPEFIQEKIRYAENLIRKIEMSLPRG